MWEALGWAAAFGVGLLIVTFLFSPAKLAFEADFPNDGKVWLILFSLMAVVAVIGIGGMAFGTLQIERAYNGRASVPAGPPAPPPMTPQEERLADYKKRDYVEPKSVVFEYDPKQGGPTPAELPLSATIIAKKGKVEADGIWTKLGAIVYENGATADFKILMLFDDETWHRADSERFEQKRKGRPVHIAKALAEEYVSNTTQGTDWVYCFGLASSDTDDEERNERRSYDRAANLCRALVNLDYIKPGRGIGLGFGYATGEVALRRQYSRQRAAIIVGVSVMQKVRISDLAASVASELEVDGVVMTSYSRPLTNPYIIRGIGKGEYNGVADLVPPDPDDDDFFDVGPMEEKN